MHYIEHRNKNHKQLCKIHKTNFRLIKFFKCFIFIDRLRNYTGGKILILVWIRLIL